MAMRLELLQYQAYHAPAARPRRPVQHGARVVNRSEKIGQQKSHSFQLNSQSCHFFNANSVFLLCPHGRRLADTVPGGRAPAAQASGRHRWEKDEWSDFNPGSEDQAGGGGPGAFLAGLVKTIFKLAGVVLILSAVFTAAAPAILSWPRGLKTVLSLASQTIPGTVSVAYASLGWSKPVVLGGITVKGVDGRTVVSIPKVETQASLWSIVRGKTGLGDAVVTAPVVDLQQEPASGQPHLALALTPREKLEANNPNAAANKKGKRPAPVEPSTDVALAASVKVPGGGLEVVNGKIILPQEAATAVGHRIFLDVVAGRFATEDNEALAKSVGEYRGKVPVRGNLYSDRAQAEGLGFLSLRRLEVELLRPLKAQIDMTPAFGKLYLARVNPFLAEIIGPRLRADDLPDITLHVAPSHFVLPSDEYSIRIEPMRTTLAKGPLVEGVLNLLSREDLSKRITAQTSAIESTINLKTGILSCSRLDLLILERVHVAAWGIVDTAHETVQMTLAIPRRTLLDRLGISRVPHDYYLKIPIRGTLERPQVDWLAAGKGVAQLTLRQHKGGEIFSSFFQQFEGPATEVPKPVDVLPWDLRI